MDETARLASLRSLRILDTDSEEAFDRLARFAGEATDMPVALITLVDEARVWLKSRIGVDVAETPRDQALCSTAIATDDVLVVENAAEDARFSSSTTVTELGARFYAGAPVRLADGAVVGTICVLDIRPRPALSTANLALLRGLAVAVGHLLDLRREIAERRDTERKLVEHTRLLELADEMAGVGTWRINLTTGAIRISSATARIYGLRPDDLTPLIATLIATFGEADRARVLGLIQGARMTGTVNGESHDLRLRRVDDGALCDVRFKARLERIGLDGDPYLVGVFQDVTVEKKALTFLNDQRVESDRRANRMGRLAVTDALTGMLNRYGFIETAETVLRADATAHLALIDLDHFKAVNDRHGHDVGDLALEMFGQTCLRIVEAGAFFGRVGGEEFALMMSDRGPVEAAALLERLRDAVNDRPIALPSGERITLTFSAGIAQANPRETWRSLFKRADEALYRAKNEGRDRLAVAA